MKKIIDSLKYVKFSDFLSPFIFILVFIPSLIFRLINLILKRKLWLVCEDGLHARDNGYHFYKYMRTKHPDDYCFYVIDKNNPDYNKVKEYGNIIQYKSLKHWLFYMSAKLNISNQKNGNPNQIFWYVIHVSFKLYYNRVFLQHGITINDGKWMYYQNTNFKYIICGAKKEYEFILDKFGYPEKNVIYTGFPRFDNLHDCTIDSKQIIIMPTWRNWLGRETNGLVDSIDFTETPYFKYWNGLLNNQDFINYIEENNLKVLFYPHSNMQKYINYFTFTSKNIVLCDFTTDIQTVLKESALMITDYSSVSMDFAYMMKPLLYFQFDLVEYREKQLQEGYFKYDLNGFGPVFTIQHEIVDYMKKIYVNSQFDVEKIYLDRMNRFFELKDSNNCERIYKEISK